MDQFYQTLRKIQKKERSNSTLARVEETFYHDIHEYLNQLRKSASGDLFAKEYTLIRDTQRVATEICERREHKITDAAVVNIHRSYRLFTGKPKFDLIDTTPLNLTPEEEKFYFSLIDTLKNHRNAISLIDIVEDSDDSKKRERTVSKEVIIEEPRKEVPLTPTTEKKESSEDSDKTLDRLNQISKAKVITDEKREPIEKQVNSQKYKTEDFPEIIHEKDQFVDLESKKLAKESELVTLLVFDDVNAIVGVDEKVYGPFFNQDVVVMPKINAMIFVKNRKGRLVKV